MESDGEGENNGMWEWDDSEEGIDNEEEGPDDHTEDDADIPADLDPDEHAALMEDTAAVCAVITTVHLTPLHNAFMMNSYPDSTTRLCNHRSTTIALPAWHRVCNDLNMKPKLIPHDVVT
jgi:hypothetical protein